MFQLLTSRLGQVLLPLKLSVPLSQRSRQSLLRLLQILHLRLKFPVLILGPSDLALKTLSGFLLHDLFMGEFSQLILELLYHVLVVL